MQNIIHHTHGRIRVKNKTFRGNLSLLKAKLYELEGVLEIRHNKYAGSITIHYDPAMQNGDNILVLLNKSAQPVDDKSHHYSQKPQNKRRSLIKASEITSRAGQIAFAMLLEKGVRYSMKSILGV